MDAEIVTSSISFVFYSEVILTLLISFTLLAGTILNTLMLKKLLIVEVAAYTTIVALRPSEYNLDTLYYFGYAESFSSLEGIELLLATKFEPLHLALVIASGDFRFWLVTESIVYFSLFIILYKKTTRVESLAIVLGCTLPLLSSSLRFSVALLSIAVALQCVRESKWRFLWLTLIGAATHASLVVAGVFEKRRLYLIISMAIVFSVAAYFSEELNERVGGNQEFGGLRGLRTTVCLVIFIGYLSYVYPKYKRNHLVPDMGACSFLFIVATLFFPIINRWLILLLIIMTASVKTNNQRKNIHQEVQYVFSAFIFSCLAFPQWVILLSRDVLSQDMLEAW